MTKSTETSESLADRMERWVARFADRVPDWEAFEEAKIPGFHRAQHRYVGAGASGKHGDPKAIPPGNFTVSVMLIPAGQGNPPHTHEVEEVFFVLDGELTCFWVEGEERVDRVLVRWDMVFNHADVADGDQHKTNRDVYTAHMLGRPRPQPCFIAMPVFLSRTFRHSAIYVRSDSGIERPEDLAGRRVGVPEYGLTALTWVRAFLQHDYGVHPSTIKWMMGGEEQPGREE